jgi:hypothetical protein
MHTQQANRTRKVEEDKNPQKNQPKKAMPTYRQSDPSKALTAQKELQFGKAPALQGGVFVRTPAGALELGFTLDTSQSMDRLLEAAANGFNQFIDEQKAAGPGFLAFNCFSDQIFTIHEGLELGSVPKIDRAFLAEKSGGTALLDGIGLIITAVAARFDKLPAPRRGALVAILTDGMENSSRKFSKSEIFQMIHYRRSVHHWEFLFICADEAGEQYGLSLGIQKANICRFDTSPEGIKLLLGRLSKAAGAFRLGDRNFAGFLTDRTK